MINRPSTSTMPQETFGHSVAEWPGRGLKAQPTTRLIPLYGSLEKSKYQLEVRGVLCMYGELITLSHEQRQRFYFYVKVAS
jgi:hypothetical protein